MLPGGYPLDKSVSYPSYQASVYRSREAIAVIRVALPNCLSIMEFLANASVRLFYLDRAFLQYGGSNVS